jgi:DNA repair protein RadC
MQNLMIKSGSHYRKATPAEIAEVHGAYVFEAVNRSRPVLTAPATAATFLRDALVGLDYEVFVVVLLDNRHRLIRVEPMFRGTIDGANVYPREVVKAALLAGAAAVIFCHNHPSGVAEASQADELITRRLRDALALVDIRVLDHLIIGLNKTLSFAERGLL